MGTHQRRLDRLPDGLACPTSWLAVSSQCCCAGGQGQETQLCLVLAASPPLLWSQLRITAASPAHPGGGCFAGPGGHFTTALEAGVVFGFW